MINARKVEAIAVLIGWLAMCGAAASMAGVVWMLVTGDWRFTFPFSFLGGMP